MLKKWVLRRFWKGLKLRPKDQADQSMEKEDDAKEVRCGFVFGGGNNRRVSSLCLCLRACCSWGGGLEQHTGRRQWKEGQSAHIQA